MRQLNSPHRPQTLYHETDPGFEALVSSPSTVNRNGGLSLRKRGGGVVFT